MATNAPSMGAQLRAPFEHTPDQSCSHALESASNPDALLLTAWSLWQEGHRAISLLSDQAKGNTVWAGIDGAEKVIRTCVAATAQGVSAQLWVALNHCVESDSDAATVNGDLAALADDSALDWRARLIIAALRSLDAMAKACHHAETGQDPVDAYWHAFDAFEAGEVRTYEYHAAFRALCAWTPPTAMDFVRKFEALGSAAGCPAEEIESRMVAQAAALLGGPRAGREA